MKDDASDISREEMSKAKALCQRKLSKTIKLQVLELVQLPLRQGFQSPAIEQVRPHDEVPDRQRLAFEGEPWFGSMWEHSSKPQIAFVR